MSPSICSREFPDIGLGSITSELVSMIWRQHWMRSGQNILPSGGSIGHPARPARAIYLSHDPAGNISALSQNSSPEQTPSERSKPVNFGRWSEANPEDRYLHHYAIRTRRAEECAEFYEDLFGFSRGSGRADDPNHYLSDGRVTLMLIPWHITDYADISVTGRGPDHIGFKVEDAEVAKQEIEDFFSRFSPGQAPPPSATSSNSTMPSGSSKKTAT